MLGLRPEDIIAYDWQAHKKLMPPFFIAVDHVYQRVVLAVRGAHIVVCLGLIYDREYVSGGCVGRCDCLSDSFLGMRNKYRYMQ